MRKRILSTFLLWTIVLVCIGVFKATGGIWLLTVIAVLTLREFYALVRRLGLEPFDRVGMLFGGLVTLAPKYGEPHGIGPMELLAVSVIVFVAALPGPHARVITDRDVLLPKLLYWPVSMVCFFAITIWVFY